MQVHNKPMKSCPTHVRICAVWAVTNDQNIKYLERQWLIIMGYFKPIMVYFGV